MPVNHPIFGERTLKPGYQYTDIQLNVLGRAWEYELPQNRLFCVPIGIGKINFTQETLVEAFISRQLPLQIMCPVNKNGNHWVSVAILLSEGEGGVINVRVGYSDSLSHENSFPEHLKKQCQAIFNQLHYNVQYEVYQHRWMQGDCVSCGPYTIENTRRFFDGKGSEPNPGQQHIREQQLLQMTTFEAVNGCSTAASLKSRQKQALVVQQKPIITWQKAAIALQKQLYVSQVNDPEYACVYIIAELYQGHGDVALALAKDKPELLDKCLTLISVLNDKDQNWDALGKVCVALYTVIDIWNAYKKYNKTINYDSTEAQIRKQLRLLNSAIRRCDANIFMALLYKINDFFSTLYKAIIDSNWQPDCEAIDKMPISKKEDLQEELTWVDARLKCGFFAKQAERLIEDKLPLVLIA